MVEPVTGLSAAVTVVPYAAVKPYSKVTVVLELLALTVPFNVAPVALIPLAGSVVTVGEIALVVKVRSPPLAVPPVLTPTTRKWYVVLGSKPLKV